MHGRVPRAVRTGGADRCGLRCRRLRTRAGHADLRRAGNIVTTRFERVPNPYPQDDARWDSTELWFESIALTDANGIVHVTDDRRIVVDAGGHIAVEPSVEAVGVEVQVDSVAAQHDLPANAELLGVASANPITVDALADNTCTTYFGQAQAIWRVSTETSGIVCSTNALMPSS